MHSDVSHKLLHGIVLQVAIASVHLQRLVADLWGQTCHLAIGDTTVSHTHTHTHTVLQGTC